MSQLPLPQAFRRGSPAVERTQHPELRLCSCLFLFPRVPVCLRAPLPARPPSVPKTPSFCARPPHIRAISGFGLKALRRRFLRPPARTTRHTRQALGAPGLLHGIPNLGLAPAGGRMGGAGATPPAKLRGPQWPAQALTLSGTQLCVNCRFGNGR